MKNIVHPIWLPAAAVMGFAISFVFGDLLTLPLDLYYLIYLSLVFGFLSFYVVTTGLDLQSWLLRRCVWGVVLGLLGGLVLMQGVLARAETAKLCGAMLYWALFWRGLAYGCVDGLLLLAFPWVVVWRSFGAEEAGWGRRLSAGIAGLGGHPPAHHRLSLGISRFPIGEDRATEHRCHHSRRPDPR